ncbi:MAG: response regulator [Verrucomicrobiia bacterium]|jgi:CheY-like chemotaxis protein
MVPQERCVASSSFIFARAARANPSEIGRLNACFGSVISSNCPQKECILAIDDEEGFLSMLKSALESYGFVVHTASRPKEAIKFYQERGRDISIVLLDYLLPGMSGDSVFEELQRLNPDVRVVLLTGCEESVADRMRRKGLRGYLQKPFDLPDLAQKVRDVIHAPVLAGSASPSPV